MLLDVAKLPREGEAFDVVVIGAGGAGMSAALFAAIDGPGCCWSSAPNTSAERRPTPPVPPGFQGRATPPRSSKGDTLENADTYLQRAIGDRTPQALRKAFLEHGPAVVDHVEANPR